MKYILIALVSVLITTALMAYFIVEFLVKTIILLAVVVWNFSFKKEWLKCFSLVYIVNPICVLGIFVMLNRIGNYNWWIVAEVEYSNYFLTPIKIWRKEFLG